MNTAATGLSVKARTISSHQIPLSCDSEADFSALLSATIARAPSLFKFAPVVLDLSDWVEDKLSLSHAIDICRQHELVPFAITSTNPDHQPLANTNLLTWLELKTARHTHKTAEATAITETKVINQPVRSGQQIYAANAHLLVTSQVGAGAEVIADGNVHVLGAVRGRAIAGAQGWQHAEIVCQQMHAELIAIAGHYLVQDDFPSGEGGARCYLQGSKMNIDFF